MISEVLALLFLLRIKIKAQFFTAALQSHNGIAEGTGNRLPQPPPLHPLSPELLPLPLTVTVVAMTV